MKHVRLTTYGRETTNISWSFSVTPHRHRLYFIHDGFCSFETTDGLFTPQKGRLYLIPASQKIQPLIAENTNFDHSYADFIMLTQLNYNKTIDITSLNNDIINSACNTLLKIAEHHQYTGISDEYFFIIESHLNNLISLMIAEGLFSATSPNQIAPAINYILTHYSENITIEKLSDLCHLSQSYFIFLFTQTMGCPPHRYIKKHRFSQALSMLRSGLSPQVVANNIGYSSLASFSNSFKNYFGFSPSNVKKMTQA